MEAETLLYEPLEKPSFVVDGLIPTGLSLFCGSQKIGKSWLMLKLCLCVSQGLPLWDMPTKAGDVLYLCLEDTFFRIQDRLFRLTDEANRKLHFAVASCKLSDGLMVQLEDYLQAIKICYRFGGYIGERRFKAKVLRNTGGRYERQGDYLIPCIALPTEKEQPIGLFGRRHLDYLKQYRKVTYTNLLTSGRLNSYLADIDRQAQERLERLIEGMKQAQGITEQLKAENALEWVGRMNNIQACAMEIVNEEIIYA